MTATRAHTRPRARGNARLRSPTIRARVYDLLERCVEDGIAYGLTRAHKHTDAPSREHVAEQVRNAVMSELCEWFELPEAKP